MGFIEDFFDRGERCHVGPHIPKSKYSTPVLLLHKLPLEHSALPPCWVCLLPWSPSEHQWLQMGGQWTETLPMCSASPWEWCPPVDTATNTSTTYTHSICISHYIKGKHILVPIKTHSKIWTTSPATKVKWEPHHIIHFGSRCVNCRILD